MVKKILNNFLNILENNEYLILYITSLVILYVCFLGEKIPYFLEKIFKNKIIKIIGILLIIFGAKNNTFMPIMFTLAFLITIDKSSVNKVNKIKKINEINKNKETFSEREYTKEDLSYKNEIKKLVKIKENFSQKLDDEIKEDDKVININNCPSKYADDDTIRKDFIDNTDNELKTLFIKNRCKKNNESIYPKPGDLFMKITEIKTELQNDKNTEVAKRELKDKLDLLEIKYNTYRQIFNDYKEYERKNIDLDDLEYNWIDINYVIDF